MDGLDRFVWIVPICVLSAALRGFWGAKPERVPGTLQWDPYVRL